MSSGIDPEHPFFRGIPPDHLRAIAEDEPVIDHLLERAKAALAVITICPPRENLSLHLAVKMGEAMNGAALQCHQAFDWYALENSVVEMIGVALRLLLEGDARNGIRSPYKEIAQRRRQVTYAICGDCLRIKPLSEHHPQDADICSCGGDFCACEYCSETARLLLLGERRKDVLGRKGEGELQSWCPESGTADP